MDFSKKLIGRRKHGYKEWKNIEGRLTGNRFVTKLGCAISVTVKENILSQGFLKPTGLPSCLTLFTQADHSLGGSRWKDVNTSTDWVVSESPDRGTRKKGAKFSETPLPLPPLSASPTYTKTQKVFRGGGELLYSLTPRHCESIPLAESPALLLGPRVVLVPATKAHLRVT